MRYIGTMEPENEYKTAELARRFNVHANTIRDWSNRFEDVLSKRATAAKRTFTHEDALIMATIAELRNVGLSFDAVREAIDNGQRSELPELPTKQETEARQQVALIPQPEYERALDSVKQLTSELDRTRQALAKAEGDKAQLQGRVIELERNLADAKARADIISQERRPATFWLVIIAAVVVVVIIIVVVLMRGVG